MQESRVGSKGELFPPKEFREKLGLRARTKVIYKIESGRLVDHAIKVKSWFSLVFFVTHMLDKQDKAFVGSSQPPAFFHWIPERI